MVANILKDSSKARDLDFLINHGMKEQLAKKLDDGQRKQLVSFAMDHIKALNLTQMLIQLASMELRGKPGSIFLAANHIATVIQLKNLEGDIIRNLVDDFEISGDESITSRLLRKILIAKQQEKMYVKTGGMKGEHHAPNEFQNFTL